MTTAVSVRNAEITFGTVTVLRDLSIDVEDGEFLVLLGPSGCGKSTLLGAIAGLIDLSDGEIWLRGENVTWAEPKDRGIGMVFQSYALYPRMTVRENLSFGLRVAGADKGTIATKVADAAKMLQLEPLLNRRPADLSGGQRQRVAIGRALVRDAAMFLFDEPLSNLDAKLRNELRLEIHRLHRTLGRTMIYVTHDQVEALTLADRIAVMKDGIIRQLGTPDEIYHAPQDTFVAGFVGSPAMNMLEGKLTGTQLHLDSGSRIDMARYGFAKAPAAAERRAILGVRPEQLHPAQTLPACLSGTVDLIESFGASTVHWCRIGALGFSFTLPGRSVIAPGEAVTVGFDPAEVSLFDAATGLRL